MQKEKFFNRRLANREITDQSDSPFLDKMIGNDFAIFSRTDIKNKLDMHTYEKLKNLKFKFIFDFTNLTIGSDLAEYLENGELILRPDKKIFGISTKKFDINQLALELLEQIE